ncbi:hypothetical protein [Psychromonas ingrahamii]|nr:hypothetical protein [Psychromonas ingrahamii]
MLSVGCVPQEAEIGAPSAPYGLFHRQCIAQVRQLNTIIQPILYLKMMYI